MERLQSTDWRKLCAQSWQHITTAAIWTAAVLLVTYRLLRGGLKNTIRALHWLLAQLERLDAWLSAGEQPQQQPATLAEITRPITQRQGPYLDEAMGMTTAGLREYLGIKAKFSRAELIRRYIAVRAKQAS